PVTISALISRLVVLSYLSFLPLLLFFSLLRLPPTSTLFPYTTLFRSDLHRRRMERHQGAVGPRMGLPARRRPLRRARAHHERDRSEEHTSELQSRFDLVCRLLLEKKKKLATPPSATITEIGSSADDCC